jgi:hypothetical protein
MEKGPFKREVAQVARVGRLREEAARCRRQFGE